jgi:hypothetical protein
MSAGRLNTLSLIRAAPEFDVLVATAGTTTCLRCNDGDYARTNCERRRGFLRVTLRLCALA